MKVIERQYRYQIRNKHCSDDGEWYPWHTCDKSKFDEINEYIKQGFAYQTRTLAVIEANADIAA